ncbi:MAG: hypothetical protein K0Q94_900 [Paenibacillus sp.]|jgi:hypothetical protein|nr:hypothetical protein [Paenibacillus sp.]
MASWVRFRERNVTGWAKKTDYGTGGGLVLQSVFAVYGEVTVFSPDRA